MRPDEHALDGDARASVVVVAKSPLHVLNGVEAVLSFGRSLDETALVALYEPGPYENQLRELAAHYGWARVIWVPVSKRNDAGELGIFARRVERLRTIRSWQSLVAEVRHPTLLFAPSVRLKMIGEVRGWLAADVVVGIDDGTLTEELLRGGRGTVRRQAGGPFRAALRLARRVRRKLRRTRKKLRRLRGRTGRRLDRWIDRFALGRDPGGAPPRVHFTMYDQVPLPPPHTLRVNRYAHLTDQAQAINLDGKRAVFLGAPLVERGFIEQAVLLDLLESVRSALAPADVTYVAHPAESDDLLAAIAAELGIPTQRWDRPAELELLLPADGTGPGVVASWFGTTLDVLGSMGGQGARLVAFRVPFDEWSVSRHNRTIVDAAERFWERALDSTSIEVIDLRRSPAPDDPVVDRTIQRGSI